MFVVSHACGPWQLPELRGVLIGEKESRRDKTICNRTRRK